MQSLKGKIAIVTGSTQRMGKAIAERLANDDAAVVISSKHGGALNPDRSFHGLECGRGCRESFPASAAGGASYLKALKAPFPQIELMPTGGVTLDTAKDFIRAGACATGVGSDLADLKAVRMGETEKIKQLAGRYLGSAPETRAMMNLPSEK